MEIPKSEGRAFDLSRPSPELFFNRELSWLAFNERVLSEARDPTVPLLERLKFVAIAANNLDEFLMVRVAGLFGQARDGVQSLSPDGLSPGEQLAIIAQRVAKMRQTMSEIILGEILPALEGFGVYLLSMSSLSRLGREYAIDHFHRQVFPLLTPLAIDPGHPFPHVRNKSLNLIAVLSGSPSPRSAIAFAVVQVPHVIPRLVRIPPEEGGSVRAAFILLDDLISSSMDALFPGFHCHGAWPFRVIRNFDLSIDEEEAEDLLEVVKQEMRRRDRGNAVALLVDRRIEPAALDMLRQSIGVDSQYLFRVEGPLNLPDLLGLGEPLHDDPSPSLRDEPFQPQRLPPFRNQDDIFAVISQGDVLLHHPYESFDPVVEFIEQAATDPNVLAIKQTLYRTSGDSPIVEALIRAAENGKQVTALVEIKARFDEENNIAWARRLEEAGVHVIYGLVGLKTHVKAALVVRREGNELRRYLHLGTGNYNPTTARTYTDFSFFTCKSDFGEDATSLFNLLTSCTAPSNWKKLVVAPLGLHERILSLIEREADFARQGKPARIIAKMNALVDPDVIMALYRASQAGVVVRLIVRGICCLRPGLPGISENIEVRAVVDRFLEHARVFVFEAGGAQEVYCSSADWMPRNFHRRVEVLFPIEDEGIRKRIIHDILAIELRDDVKARILRPDGTYEKAPFREGIRSQLEFLRRAKEAASVADEQEHQERPFIVRPVRTRPTLGATMGISTPITPEGQPPHQGPPPPREASSESQKAPEAREGGGHPALCDHPVFSSEMGISEAE
ncbi:MAG: polyphosphate kinase 1 [Sandaracinaceae bacterium]|nr:polyphosphate kinase 1 [Sandaracinaceae bacterium]